MDNSATAIKIASQIIDLLAEAKASVEEAHEIIRFVSRKIEETATVVKTDLSGLKEDF